MTTTFLVNNFSRTDLLLKTGVYALVNKVTNKFYIGSASSKYGFYQRWKHHISLLRGRQKKRDHSTKEHHSIYLQRAWDKYGEENFEFRILEFVEPEFCIEVEQEYLDLSKTTFLYNSSKNACNCLGVTHSQDTKDKISKAHKGKTTPESVKEKMRVSYKNRDGAKIQTERAAKTYTFSNPLGEIIEIKNLKLYCKTNNLSYDSMLKLSKGFNNNHKGWTRVGEKAKSNILEGELISPKGEYFKFKNLANFSKTNNFNSRSYYDLLNNRRLHSNGWTINVENHNKYKERYELRGITKVYKKYSVRLPAKIAKSKERIVLGYYLDLAEAKFARDLAEVIWDFEYKVSSRKN